MHPLAYYFHMQNVVPVNAAGIAKYVVLSYSWNLPKLALFQAKTPISRKFGLFVSMFVCLWNLFNIGVGVII